MMPSAGLEPAATRLKGERSTTELRRLGHVALYNFICIHDFFFSGPNPIIALINGIAIIINITQ